MKYYSEKTKKFYDSVKDCNKAERDFDEEKAKKDAELAELRANKKKDADEINKKAELVRAKFDEARELQKEYYKDVQAFNEKYKEPVRTVVTVENTNPWDIFDEMEKQLGFIDQTIKPFFTLFR